MAGVRHAACALLLAPLALVSGCGDEDPHAAVFELAGRVQDRSTGRGIGGADVRYVSDTLDEASTTSDGDGSYRLVIMTTTPFGQVRADKAGWLPDERTVFFDASPRRMDLRLREAPPDD
jgi:hypothetical protein